MTSVGITKAPPISSREFSSHERSGTVKFADSGSGKKGRHPLFSHWSDLTHTPGATVERKYFLRMFGARKACYKCGNGVSGPLCIIRVYADAVELMELGTLRKLPPYDALSAFDCRVAPTALKKGSVSIARSRVRFRSCRDD
jgi:hypothetical protein